MVRGAIITNTIMAIRIMRVLVIKSITRPGYDTDAINSSLICVLCYITVCVMHMCVDWLTFACDMWSSQSIIIMGGSPSSLTPQPTRQYPVPLTPADGCSLLLPSPQPIIDVITNAMDGVKTISSLIVDYMGLCDQRYRAHALSFNDAEHYNASYIGFMSCDASLPRRQMPAGQIDVDPVNHRRIYGTRYNTYLPHDMIGDNDGVHVCDMFAAIGTCPVTRPAQVVNMLSRRTIFIMGHDGHSEDKEPTSYLEAARYSGKKKKVEDEDRAIMLVACSVDAIIASASSSHVPAKETIASLLPWRTCRPLPIIIDTVHRAVVWRDRVIIIGVTKTHRPTCWYTCVHAVELGVGC